MRWNVVIVCWSRQDNSVVVGTVKALQMVFVEPKRWERCSGWHWRICSAQLEWACDCSMQRCDAQHDRCANVRMHVKVTSGTCRGDQYDGGHIVRGKDDDDVCSTRSPSGNRVGSCDPSLLVRDTCAGMQNEGQRSWSARRGPSRT